MCVINLLIYFVNICWKYILLCVREMVIERVFLVLGVLGYFEVERA